MSSICKNNPEVLNTKENIDPDTFLHFKILIENINDFVYKVKTRSKLESICLPDDYLKLTPMRLWFPFFGTFRNDVIPNWDTLAGSELESSLIIPVDFTSTYKNITTFGDVVSTLRSVIDTLVLLGNQKSLISHSYMLRAELVHYVILKVFSLFI